MEQTFVSCIQQTVKVLAENYKFDYDEALALFGLDNLKVTTNLGKTKGVGAVGDAPKRTKPKFPLPFTGEVFDDCCRAIVFNGGLFTQCFKAPKPESQNSLCQTCEKQAEKTPLGNPPLGYISERLEKGEDWADPKGRRPVPYTKVMKTKNFTQEEVMEEVSKYGMNIDMTVFDDTDTEKRGRKKGGKKTEVQPVFGDDDEEEGLLRDLIQGVKDSESETSEASKTSKTSKKSKEEREAEKLEKASQKSENDMMKAEEKRMKDFKKDQEKKAKDEEKRLAKEAKDQEKKAKDEEKKAKDEEKRLAKEAKAKAASEKKSKKEKVVEPEVVEPEVVEDLEALEEVEEVPPSPMDPPPLSPPLAPVVEEPVVEEPVVEEPVVSVKKIRKFKGPDGVSYVADSDNIVYRKDAPTVRIGVLTPVGLVLDEQDEEDEEEEEEEDLSDVE
jgi:hypothetical protein